MLIVWERKNKKKKETFESAYINEQKSLLLWLQSLAKSFKEFFVSFLFNATSPQGRNLFLRCKTFFLFFNFIFSFPHSAPQHHDEPVNFQQCITMFRGKMKRKRERERAWENYGGVKNLSKEWKIVSLWFQPHNYFDEDELDVFVFSLALSLLLVLAHSFSTLA